MNVSLFGVKIFVKGRPDDAVVVYGYAELLCKLVQVGWISSFNYLSTFGRLLR